MKAKDLFTRFDAGSLYGLGLAYLGLQKTSLVDYPGKVAATIFTASCNLRCPYCHNPELISGICASRSSQRGAAPGGRQAFQPADSTLSEDVGTPGLSARSPLPAGGIGIPTGFLPIDEIIAFLKKRSKVLDGLVITGGEPLLHPKLPVFIRDLQHMGFEIKVDTNGCLPGRLKSMNADFIALDIKTIPDKYPALLSAPKNAPEALRESITYVKASGIEHEFRTTVVPGIVDMTVVKTIIQLIGPGATWALNQFRNDNTLDPSLRQRAPYDRDFLEQIKSAGEKAGIHCMIRGVE